MPPCVVVNRCVGLRLYQLSAFSVNSAVSRHSPADNMRCFFSRVSLSSSLFAQQTHLRVGGYNPSTITLKLFFSSLCVALPLGDFASNSF